MDRWIINAPRWLILAALIYAPWAYGATRPWTITGLNWLLGSAVVAWFISHVLQQRRPTINALFAGTLLFLIAQSWFMVFNAKYDYDRLGHNFITLTPMFPWAPGSLDRELSVESATRLSLLLLSGLVVFEMTEHSLWRKRLLGTMAMVTCSIVILGLTQRFTNSPGIFWQNENFGPNFFATFRNHTNAGAFINLAWPLAVVCGVREIIKKGLRWKVVFWTAVSVVCVTGVMVNTSRAATALAVAMVLITGVWLLWQALKGRAGNVGPTTLAVTGVMMLAIIGALALLTGLDSNVGRWRQFEKQLTEDNSRLIAAKVCLKMIPESGWWGFGSGTFETAFPYFTEEFGNQIKGRWIYAHQDYLQTLVEWGYVGFAGWAILLGGAVVQSFRRRLVVRTKLKDSAKVLHFGILTGLVSVLAHAMVDFPLQIGSIQLYVVVLIALLWSSRNWMKPEHRRTNSRRQTVKFETMAIAS